MNKKLLFFLTFLFCIKLINAQPSKVAFVSTFTTLNNLQNSGDDDEYAAANWLVNIYGGVFVPVSQIKNSTIDLSDYKALWIHFDRQSDETTINNEFAAAFLDADVKTAINNFYKSGGNLLLSTFATRYVVDLGRYDLPNDMKGFGDGGNNNDTWYISPTWGTFSGAPEVFNRFTDPLYVGMTGVENVIKGNGNSYPRIPLIGSGWKEDHNYFWNPQPDKANDDKYKMIDFENNWNTNSLGTWGHVEDYCGTAITRWNPKDDFNGKAITIGIAAYEWNQNSGTNEFQSNIERLTKNALDELSFEDLSTQTLYREKYISKIVVKNQSVLFKNFSEGAKVNIYSIEGQIMSSFIISESQYTLNISNFNSGLYLIETYEGNNKSIHKFIYSL